MNQIRKLNQSIAGHPFRTLVANIIENIMIMLVMFHAAMALMASRGWAIASTSFGDYTQFSEFTVGIAQVVTGFILLFYGAFFVFAFLAFVFAFVLAFAELKLPYKHVFGCMAIALAAIAAGTGMFMPLSWGIAIVGGLMLALAGIAYKYPSWVHAPATPVASSEAPSPYSPP